MPAKSKSQFRFMKWLEHNPEEAKKRGLSSEKAREYTKENVGSKKFSRLREKIFNKKRG